MILYLFGDYSKSITINRSSVKKEIRFAFAYDNYDETKFVVEVPVGQLRKTKGFTMSQQKPSGSWVEVFEDQNNIFLTGVQTL